MQRAVRQRCSFGCVICGFPLYEYHHIIPYADVKEHSADNLTLLCDGHHREATNGLLTTEQIQAANSAPCNGKRGVSHPFQLHFSGSVISVGLGNNRFCGGINSVDGGLVFIAISVDDYDVIWFHVDSDGQVFLHANFLDECNLPLLVVNENVLTYRADCWDITFEGRTLTLRHGLRDIFLELEFCPPNHFQVCRGRLLCNGVEIQIIPDGLIIVNSGQLITNSVGQGGAIGLQLGRNERRFPSCFCAAPDSLSRYDVNRKKNIADALNRQKMFAEILKAAKGSSKAD